MKKLEKRQEWLYAASGFGPNLLMIFITAYFLDAIIPTGLVVDKGLWSFTGFMLVVPAAFSIMFTIAKIIDGLIDVPLASLTDNMRSKWGKRRPIIALGLIPMILSYVLLWIPLSKTENSVFNTIWMILMILIFFVSYTMCMVTYYGSFAEITHDVRQRSRLSNWKAFFDTIGYCIAYALLPLFIGFGFHIQSIVMCSLPLMLTMLIPLFLLKENSNEAAEQTEAEPKIGMIKSIALTVSNKSFLRWLAVLAAFYCGLQIFLAGQNVIASGPMELNGWMIAIMNTAAFAPVPLMLLLYNKVMKKKGFRFAIQSALLAFALAMVTFFFAYKGYVPNVYARLGIGAAGGTIGSYAIGAFFSAPYMIPSQIAAEEVKKTGKNHSAMYFAVQGLANQVFAAIGTGVIYINIKNIAPAGNPTLGIHIVPLIVAGLMLISFALAFLLPKRFAMQKTVGEDGEKDPSEPSVERFDLDESESDASKK